MEKIWPGPYRFTLKEGEPGQPPFITFEPAADTLPGAFGDLFRLDLKDGATIDDGEQLAASLNKLVSKFTLVQ